MKLNGFLKESVSNVPKVLTYKSANKLNEHAVFNKAVSYIRNKYGVILEMADIEDDNTSQYDQKLLDKIARRAIKAVYDEWANFHGSPEKQR